MVFSGRQPLYLIRQMAPPFGNTRKWRETLFHIRSLDVSAMALIPRENIVSVWH